MGGIDGALAHRNRSAAHGVDAERLERGAHAHDVHDGVERTDLVEVNLVGRNPVNQAFGDCQRLEDVHRALPHAFIQRRHNEQFPYVPPAPVMMALRRIDDGVSGGNLVSGHPLEAQLPAVEPERVDLGGDEVEICARIQQRAERHVTGDARHRVEPGHRVARRLMSRGDSRLGSCGTRIDDGRAGSVAVVHHPALSR